MVMEVYENARQRVVEHDLGAMELLAVVDTLAKAGRNDLVVALYRLWLADKPSDPLTVAIYFNLGVVLSAENDVDGAIEAFQAAIALRPDFCPPYINLGMMHERRGAPLEAVQTWYQLVNQLAGVTGEAINHKVMVLKQLGRVLIANSLDENAEDALLRSLEIRPDQPDILQQLMQLRLRQLKWPLLRPFGEYTREKQLGGFPPLTLASFTDDPLLQLALAAQYSREIGQPATHYLDRHDPNRQDAPGRRLRVGYLSSDFRSHAVGYLVSELCELHDRSKVEIFVYYCGIPQEDPTKQRIRAAAEHWQDITPLGDEAAAEQILADGIDVLIDFNGNTRDARTRMLAMRPAPVIVNWLGYPGTMGSPYHHYILADPFIIPEGSEIYYAETVKRLPCYQPSDRKRYISPTPVSRQDVGLPEDAVVFCSFNSPQKIVSHTWRRWMSILAQVPGSVLWMLGAAHPRLRELAIEQGVAPERLIDAPVRANPEHLARIPLADLFLDSLPYGAHTTASDALWMGVPILTLAGRGFAARVCGSLVTAAGMSELVCSTEDEFIAKAVRLGSDRAQLQALRQKLVAGRDGSVLFDMPGLVASLEGLCQEMHDEFRQGRLPRPDLSNLEIYKEIGISLHDDAVEMALVTDYHERYRQKLIERDRLCKIRPDARLWQKGE